MSYDFVHHYYVPGLNESVNDLLGRRYEYVESFMLTHRREHKDLIISVGYWFSMNKPGFFSTMLDLGHQYRLVFEKEIEKKTSYSSWNKILSKFSKEAHVFISSIKETCSVDFFLGICDHSTQQMYFAASDTGDTGFRIVMLKKDGVFENVSFDGKSTFLKENVFLFKKPDEMDQKSPIVFTLDATLYNKILFLSEEPYRLLDQSLNPLIQSFGHWQNRMFLDVLALCLYKTLDSNSASESSPSTIEQHIVALEEETHETIYKKQKNIFAQRDCSIVVFDLDKKL